MMAKPCKRQLLWQTTRPGWHVGDYAGANCCLPAPFWDAPLEAVCLGKVWVPAWYTSSFVSRLQMRKPLQVIKPSEMRTAIIKNSGPKVADCTRLRIPVQLQAGQDVSSNDDDHATWICQSKPALALHRQELNLRRCHSFLSKLQQACPVPLPPSINWSLHPCAVIVQAMQGCIYRKQHLMASISEGGRFPGPFLTGCQAHPRFLMRAPSIVMEAKCPASATRVPSRSRPCMLTLLPRIMRVDSLLRCSSLTFIFFCTRKL